MEGNETVRVTLRALEPADTDRIYMWENLPGMWRFGFSPAPLSRHMIWEYINSYDANPLTAGQLRLMIVAGDEAVGAIDLYDIDPVNRRAMVGVMTDPSARRRGYALKALESVAEYCRDVPGLHQIAAMIGEDNEASFALFTRAGFRRTATLPGWYHHGKTYIDAIVMQKEL